MPCSVRKTKAGSTVGMSVERPPIPTEERKPAWRRAWRRGLGCRAGLSGTRTQPQDVAAWLSNMSHELVNWPIAAPGDDRVSPACMYHLLHVLTAVVVKVCGRRP